MAKASQTAINPSKGFQASKMLQTANKAQSHKVHKMPKKTNKRRQADAHELLRYMTCLNLHHQEAGTTCPHTEQESFRPPREGAEYHQQTKTISSQTHNRQLQFKTPERKVKRRSIPFDEDRDLDPWMLFPNLQWPHSALKNDSAEYINQAREANEAREQRYRVRGSPLSAAELKDLVQMNYSLGKYATPTKRGMPPPTPESIAKRSYSPMDVD